MNYQQLLLTKLAEECAEVAQMALKCQQFGLEEISPYLKDEKRTNAQRLNDEINDVLGVIELLRQHGFGFQTNGLHIEGKILKLKKFAAYSEQLGQVQL